MYSHVENLKNVQKCNRGKNYNVLFKKLIEIPFISYNKWNKWNSCIFHFSFLHASEMQHCTCILSIFLCTPPVFGFCFFGGRDIK